MGVSVRKSWLYVGNSKPLPIAELVLDVSIAQHNEKSDEQQQVNDIHVDRSVHSSQLAGLKIYRKELSPDLDLLRMKC